MKHSSDDQCYRTSFTTDAITVYSSTYAFIGFVVVIDIAPSLAGMIPAYLYRNQADISTFSTICEPSCLSAAPALTI